MYRHSICGLRYTVIVSFASPSPSRWQRACFWVPRAQFGWYTEVFSKYLLNISDRCDTTFSSLPADSGMARPYLGLVRKHLGH